MQTVYDRLATLPQIGRVEWIGLAPVPHGDLQSVSEATLIADHGLEGDHHAKGKPGSKRQVTLIQQEHLRVIGSCLHHDAPNPGVLRRNLVVSGINLLALKKKQFAIGDCVLEHTGPCDPCSQMEQNLGPGGLNAMRGHGGITARVVTGGTFRVGDEVRAIRVTNDDNADE
jgi:MOSC domain-containing protein YiiM